MYQHFMREQLHLLDPTRDVSGPISAGDSNRIPHTWHLALHSVASDEEIQEYFGGQDEVNSVPKGAFDGNQEIQQMKRATNLEIRRTEKLPLQSLIADAQSAHALFLNTSKYN